MQHSSMAQTPLGNPDRACVGHAANHFGVSFNDVTATSRTARR
jgi:hypothetical protein